eukprot:gene10038-7929_t
MDPIDLQKIDKKVWLVKIPNAIAEQWRPIIERSLNNSNLDEDLDQAGELGSIRFEVRQQEAFGETPPCVSGLEATPAL